MGVTISVVIPAYDESELLEETLLALDAQTRPADEIIVVDNNSTDATADIARRHGARVVLETEQGIMPASATGYDAATGDIIVRIDADSRVPPDWLERIESALKQYPDVVGVTGPGDFYGANAVVRLAGRWLYMYPYFVLVGAALAGCPLFGSNFALRRTTWLRIRADIHRQRRDIHDDIEVSYHLRPADRVMYVHSLRVGISARSLRLSGMRGRYAMAFRTIGLHMPGQAPWRRWAGRKVCDDVQPRP